MNSRLGGLGKASIRGDVGQVAARDINFFYGPSCPGADACPYQCDEADKQIRFEQRTTIACSGGARNALEYLLNSGVFHRKQLALAWRQNSLLWNMDKKRLVANPSVIETIYGACLMMLGIGLLFSVLGGLLLVHGARPFTIEQWEAVGVALASAMSIPLAERTLIRPNRIARRASRLLDEYYRAGDDESGTRSEEN